MKETEESRTSTVNAGADTQPPAKEPYVKPQIEVVEIELEQPILNNSGASNSPWGGSPW